MKRAKLHGRPADDARFRQSRPVDERSAPVQASKFAEILAKAMEIFRDKVEAEKWLITPAMALNQRRPVDLLSSPAGVEVVEQLRGRLEHRVYT